MYLWAQVQSAGPARFRQVSRCGMAEKLIELNSVETALEIFGSRDENIRLLEN